MTLAIIGDKVGGNMHNYGQVIGFKNSKGFGFRLDYDPEKGLHFNDIPKSRNDRHIQIKVQSFKSIDVKHKYWEYWTENGKWQ